MSQEFAHMAFGVTRFLGVLDLKSRLATMPTLYLEFPDVGSMRAAHLKIMQEIHENGNMGIKPVYEFIDDHTLRIEPFAGVSVVLSCKQRFAVKTSGSVGYRDIAFVDVPPIKKT